MYAAQRSDVLRSLNASHERFYQSKVFGGPSLHFHTRALADATRNLPRFAQSSYAMLASWGMHRMGNGGAKMADFQTYDEYLQQAWPYIRQLQKQDPRSMTQHDWEVLRCAFVSIKAMRSAFSLVGTSKVLAHALQTSSPVDRQYTIKLLHKSKNLPKDINDEWQLLRSFLEFFFYPLLQEASFMVALEMWQAQRDLYRWDTSPLKTIDNVLVGYVRGVA